LHPILEERGLGGREYMEDMIKKMTAYKPDKKINVKELKNLRGTGLDLPKYKTNIWPERLGYLETIIEDDKEFVTEKKPLRKWEKEPYDWNSDDELAEEEFTEEGKNKNLEEFLKKKRLGNSRTLQRDWYKKQGVHNLIGYKNEEEFKRIGRMDSIPGNLLEDNPIFTNELVKRRLKKSIRNKYGIMSRGNFPSQRVGIRGQLRQRSSDEAISNANRIDRERDLREVRSRMDANRLDEELFRQSRLIDGRTPVEVMDLENELRYRQTSSFGVGDNIRRDIDRMRSRRDEQILRDINENELRDELLRDDI